MNPVRRSRKGLGAGATPERSGLLAVDKPAGPTSHDVVMRVRRALADPGAGHLGTLDPAATGLLLVAVGAATRCIPLWQGGAKTYLATFRFGLETASHDLDGEVVARGDRLPAEEEIRLASVAFAGEIDQVPPMVSAVRVGGRRLHELARRGVTVEREPRRVRIESWDWLGFDGPDARARIRCSGGTYVRALARDLGRALGCGATLAALRRERSEPFGLERAVTAADLAAGDADAIWARAGVPLGDALSGRPGIVVTEAERARIAHGNPISREPGARPAGGEAGEWSVLRDEAGRPLAIAGWSEDPHDPARTWIQPRIVFPWTLGDRAR